MYARKSQVDGGELSMIWRKPYLGRCSFVREQKLSMIRGVGPAYSVWVGATCSFRFRTVGMYSGKSHLGLEAMCSRTK